MARAHVVKDVERQPQQVLKYDPPPILDRFRPRVKINRRRSTSTFAISLAGRVWADFEDSVVMRQVLARLELTIRWSVLS